MYSKVIGSNHQQFVPISLRIVNQPATFPTRPILVHLLWAAKLVLTRWLQSPERKNVGANQSFKVLQNCECWFTIVPLLKFMSKGWTDLSASLVMRQIMKCNNLTGFHFSVSSTKQYLKLVPARITRTTVLSNLSIHGTHPILEAQQTWHPSCERIFTQPAPPAAVGPPTSAFPRGLGKCVTKRS